MVAIKTAQVDAFVKSSVNDVDAWLFHGADEGLIAELAASVSKRLAAQHNPPGEVLAIEDTDLEADSERLALELQTIAMFSGRNIVRVKSSRRVTAATLKPILGGGRLEGVLIVEAGSLKSDDSLRALFEKSPSAVAIACFADTERDLDALITSVLRPHAIAITTEARAALIERLGADRSLSRGEIEKLALFAAGRSEISADDVDRSVGDSSELAIDDIVAAAAGGRLQDALRGCDRAVAAGESVHAVLAAALRHFQRLHRVKFALEAGKSLDDALRLLRPPLFFKHRDRFAAELRAWNGTRLERALARIADAQKATRNTGAMDTVIVERLLMEQAFVAGTARRAG